MFKRIILPLLLGSSLLSASIEIYQDTSVLQYTPTNSFIGFNNSIQASNAQGALQLIRGECAFNEHSYCTSAKKIIELKATNTTLNRKKNSINSILQKYNPENIEANKVLLYIQTLQEKISTVEKEINYNNYQIQQLSVQKVAPSAQPTLFATRPTQKVKLTFNGLSFQSHYRLNVDANTLEQSLHVRNRSGIDIATTDAKLTDTRLQGISPNYAFKPRLIYINQARSVQKNTRYIAKESMQDRAMSANYTPTAKKESTRTYRIKKFSLKSDGIAKRFVVNSTHIDMQKQLVWNANQAHVYESASFKTDATLESNRVDVLYHNNTIKNVPIRKDANTIYLNIAQEYAIEVSRKEIPKFSQNRGLFSSDTQTQSGYRLTLANISNTPKKIEIIERIPVSTDEKIEVELKGVWLFKSNKRLKIPFDYDTKSGKLSLHVKAAAQQRYTYEYEYSIRHKNDIKIHY